ncbi:P-loop containing nucleoside triphosphate hydrolase protein [Meredithblackwellia eburnea MCA 4105]
MITRLTSMRPPLHKALQELLENSHSHSHTALRLPRFRSASNSARPSLSPRLTPTIFAPATGRAKSAISILRVSGPDSVKVWYQMTRPPRQSKLGKVDKKDKGKGRESRLEEPKPRVATLRRIVHPTTGEVLDEGIVLYFPAESSLTAQPTLELHTHGSPALMSLLLSVLPSLSASFRIAEPGEFTRLAFEAGKMDLTEVEGIRDLVEADTEAQRKLAARQAGGHMKVAYDKMRTTIIEASSLLEALIDFGEDQGIDPAVYSQAKGKVTNLRTQIIKQLENGRRGEIIRSGVQVAIIGPPNAGKSSLFNWFAQREAAIVTSTPGTTRDVVELSLNFNGFPIIIADTAGLRVTGDEVEAIGVGRAREKARGADLKLFILPLDDPSALNDPSLLDSIDSDTLIVLNKSDSTTSANSSATVDFEDRLREKLDEKGVNWIGSRGNKGAEFLKLSVKNGDGLDGLTAEVTRLLRERYDLSDDMEDTPLITHARHRHHLEDCLRSLEAFLEMDEDLDLVDAAEELRYASLSLGRVTGVVDVEEILGEIFRGFCIGK